MIAAFNRNTIVIVRKWSWEQDGRPVEGYGPLLYAMGNIQNLKQGDTVNINDTGFWNYTNWRSVYTLTDPESVTTRPEGAPADAVTSNTYAFFNARWWLIRSVQDFTKQGRGPQHWRFYAVTENNMTNPPVIPITPEIVDRFVQVTNRLHALVIGPLDAIHNYPQP